MEFMSLSHRRSSWRNVPSGEERVETAVFAGYVFLKNKNLESNDAFALYEQELAQSVSARSSVRAVPVRLPGVTSNPCFDFCPFSVALKSFKKNARKTEYWWRKADKMSMQSALGWSVMSQQQFTFTLIIVQV